MKTTGRNVLVLTNKKIHYSLFIKMEDQSNVQPLNQRASSFNKDLLCMYHCNVFHPLKKQTYSVYLRSIHMLVIQDRMQSRADIQYHCVQSDTAQWQATRTTTECSISINNHWISSNCTPPIRHTDLRLN
jgi:hypothetical protein